jgi:integrase
VLSDYLSTEAVEILREQRLTSNGPWVFPSRTSASGHQEGIKTFWQGVVKGKAGLADVVFYDLRRTFATRMMENGADIATVMAATGHTTPGVLLKHYAKAVEGKQRAAIEGLFS